jgi:hypothetical protein
MPGKSLRFEITRSFSKRNLRGLKSDQVSGEVVVFSKRGDAKEVNIAISETFAQ